MIKSIDVSPYNVRYRDFDLRRDIHLFTDYVSNREVKRKTADNNLSVSDVKRLAKILSFAKIMDEFQKWDHSLWLGFVDYVALVLEFIDYDTEGQYRGYSSVEPSYTNNYIIYQAEKYKSFLSLSLNTQENHLLNTLIRIYNYSDNEFFAISPVGWLDGFSQFGSAVGVLPLVDFAEARMFLLRQLADMETGVWYSTASWIQELKREYPYFMIPEKPQREKQTYYSRKKNEPPVYETIPRYGTFHEKQMSRDNISDDDSDGFERVEGRFIERFLEYIPFIMGYVELAYDDNIEKSINYFRGSSQPVMRDAVKAFRVNPLLKQVLENTLPTPSVTVQPNFEVLIESPIYPASLLNTLSDFGQMTHQDQTSSLMLDKRSIAAAVAKDDSLDIVEVLSRYAKRALPQNILIELKEWAKHADVFILYDNLQLVEDHIGIENIRKLAAYTIQDDVFLISNSIPIVEQLQKQNQVVLHVNHSEDEIQVLPEGVVSLFPTWDEVEAQIVAEEVIVRLEKYTTLHFPHRDVLDAVRQGLLDRRCPVTLNASANTITFPTQFQTQLEEIIESLTEKYIITIQDLS